MFFLHAQSEVGPLSPILGGSVAFIQSREEPGHLALGGEWLDAGYWMG